MVEVYIPTPFRVHTGGTARVQLEAATVGELLTRLVDQFPALASHVLTEEGTLPEHLNVFLDEEEVRSLQGLETPLVGVRGGGPGAGHGRRGGPLALSGPAGPLRPPDPPG